jgi:hypothetical protein
MTQTTFSTAPGGAKAGMLGNIGDHHIDSMINESGADIPFGIGIVQGTSYNEAKTPSAATGQILGVVLRSDAYQNYSLTGTDGVASGDVMNVLRSGDVWVLPEQTVVPGDPVYCRFTVSSSEELGAFRKDADSGKAVLVKGLSWVKGGSSSSPALLRVRLDQAHQPGEAVAFTVTHAQVTGDTTSDPIFIVPANRYFVLDSAIYYNATGLVNDGTNYFAIQIKNSSTKMAEWSTLTGEEGAIAAATACTLTNESLTNRVAVAGDKLTLVLDETNTQTLPAGQVTVFGRLI